MNIFIETFKYLDEKDHYLRVALFIGSLGIICIILMTIFITWQTPPMAILRFLFLMIISPAIEIYLYYKRRRNDNLGTTV